MFNSVFLFEMKRWLKQPVFYVYAAVFFALSYFSAISALGAFDNLSGTTSDPVFINSPIQIAQFLNSFSTLLYFLLPTIVGASIYRDYLYNVHTVLYSYPLRKFDYLAAKFLSSLLVISFLSLLALFAFFIAQFQPGINRELIGPNHFMAYLHAFLLTALPNLLLFGSIVFALVTFVRNIYVGFVFVLVLFLLQSLLTAALQNIDNRMLVALIDPFGFEPILYYTRYWSVEQQNVEFLPLGGVLLANRLLWSGFAFLVLILVYRLFNFSQFAIGPGRSKKASKPVKDNFGSIVRVRLPSIAMDFGFWNNIKLSWRLSRRDYRYLISNWTFIILLIFAFLFSIMIIMVSGQFFGTTTYPVTWKMLTSTSGIYGFFLEIMILLVSGMLVQRSRQSNMFLLVEATATPNWVLLLSQTIALFKMLWTVLGICLLTGVIYQLYAGYFNLEIGHYLYELLVLGTLQYAYLIFFALFVHSLIKNYFVGFICCLAIVMGIPALSNLGIEQDLFKPNADPGFSYSDMNGYGDIRHFIIYRFYWLLFGLFLFGCALLFWPRGLVSSMREKFRIAKRRFNPVLFWPLVFVGLAFIGLGYTIYAETNLKQPYYGTLDRELQRVAYEKKYKRYQDLHAPRLVDVFVEMDLAPERRDLLVNGRFTYVNKTEREIDSIFMNLSQDLNTTMEFGRESRLVDRDSVLSVQIFTLEQALQPGDSLEINYRLENRPNGLLFDRSPVLANGTFLNNSIFPVLNYSPGAELQDNQVRKKYGLPDKFRMPDPADSSNRYNNYISQDADWIDFETVISTSPDQIAIAPGYLQQEWEADGRRFFHYKMDAPILNFYAFVSARYQKKEEVYKGKTLGIYYHDNHEYNLDRMMASLEKSLDYYQTNFGPYQFQQVRILEFPRTHGTFAQAFANTVPFSEAIGFIAKIDEQDDNAVDYPYSVTAHEFAHQWWAHQVIGAYARGTTMLSESLAEYSSLKVLEHTYGKGQMRRFLREALDTYLSGRSNERIRETPLMFNENQSYIHYNKGALVMYTISDLWGEEKFNNFLKGFVQKVGFQAPPYTTSIEFVDDLRHQMPDSLAYLIDDLFETVTLYDNRVEKVSEARQVGDQFELEIDFLISKYRTDAKGRKTYTNNRGDSLIYNTGDDKLFSLPLADYIDLAILGEAKESNQQEGENYIHRQRIKVDDISNHLKIRLDDKPTEVIIDPYSMFLDAAPEDNRKRVP
ncbi:MAG: M1 family aminopeptidase [Sphingobacteriaceae bacterium]